MIHLDITKEKNLSLLEFLKEYMLLAEIAYIESNAPVSSMTHTVWVIFYDSCWLKFYESF